MPLHALENDPEYIDLQTEMVWMQLWLQETRKRVIVIFEGRDTAGKGGAIMRFVRFLNPRAYRVVALPKPTEVEVGQWYFQRYIKELPRPGEIIFFDRSWYNRAVVEPVMGFCTEEQYQRFFMQVVPLEKMLVDDGITIIKLWFSINIEEQKRRLEDRKVNPLKMWKLSTVDTLAQQKWHEFTRYKDEMFRQTAKPYCPWITVKGDDRELARKEAMRYVLSQMNYSHKGESGTRIEPLPEIVKVIEK
ncbi:MAG: polyphosphate kinase 2 [Salinivirgaceae bacterium]